VIGRRPRLSLAYTRNMAKARSASRKSQNCDINDDLGRRLASPLGERRGKRWSPRRPAYLATLSWIASKIAVESRSVSGALRAQRFAFGAAEGRSGTRLFNTPSKGAAAAGAQAIAGTSSASRASNCSASLMCSKRVVRGPAR
jgi:hypothetical protein